MNNDLLKLIDSSGELQIKQFKSSILQKIENINSNSEFQNYRVELFTYEDYFEDKKKEILEDFRSDLRRISPELEYEFVLDKVASAMREILNDQKELLDKLSKNTIGDIKGLIIDHSKLLESAAQCGLEDMNIENLEKLVKSISRFETANYEIENKFKTLTVVDKLTYLMVVEESYFADKLMSDFLLQRILKEISFDFREYEQGKPGLLNELTLWASTKATKERKRILKFLWMETPNLSNISNLQN